MKGMWGFVAGIALTIILVPSMAAAAPTILSSVGIKGTSGHTANVEPDGQIYTSNAPPQNLFANPATTFGTSGGVSVVPTPTGYDAIVTSVGIDIFSLSSASVNGSVDIYIGPNGCVGVISDVRFVTATGPGDTE
jgi:hypothetical protein